jgi:hypothetical protein
VTRYVVPLNARFGDTFREVQRRLRTVEARTMGIDSGFPLMAVPAQIDPSYSSGDPMAFINGATTLTGPYQHLASYTPVAGDQVLAVPVVSQQTYVIMGRLV